MHAKQRCPVHVYEQFAASCALKSSSKRSAKKTIRLNQNTVYIGSEQSRPKLRGDGKYKIATQRIADGIRRMYVNSFVAKAKIFADVDDRSVESSNVQFDVDKTLYCATLDDHPKLFVVANRSREGTVCRVLGLTTSTKAKKVKLSLSLRFEVAYREWQSKFYLRGDEVATTNTVEDPVPNPLSSKRGSLIPSALMKLRKTSNF